MIKKPKNKPSIGDVINKGAKSPEQPDTVKRVQLRLTNEQLDAIDESISKRLVKIPRHTWLLEAVMEKLQRDG
jgi:hypothetical protein